MADSNWTAGLENQIKTIFSSPCPAQQQARPQQNNNTMFIFIMLALVVGILYSIQLKKQKSLQESNPVTQGFTYPIQQTQPVNDLETLKREYQKLDTAAAKIWERTKWNSDNLTLMATLNNHNLAVLQKGLPQSNLIFLNADWSIPRLPDQIELDEKDKEFLKRFVKN